MLEESRRQQLDGIVQKMIQNEESDQTIQMVVDDFKQKYTPAGQPEQRGVIGAINTFGNTVGGFLGEASGVNPALRSLGGLLRAPAEAAFTGFQSAADQQVASSLSVLSHVNTELVKKARALPEGDPRKASLLSQVSENMKIIENQRNTQPQITQGEIAGRTIETGARLAPFFAGVPSSYLGAAGQFGSTAGGISLGKSLSEGKPLEEALKGSIVPTIIGTGVGIFTRFLGNTLTKISQNGPERLYQSALRQSSSDLKKELVDQAPNLSKQLIEKGVTGGNNKILTQSLIGINESEKKLNQIIAQEAKKTVNTKSILDELSNLSKRYSNALGQDGSAAIDAVKQNIISKGRVISFEDALQLKRDIYSVLSNNAFNVDAALSQKAEALRVAAHSIMEQMSKASPRLAKINTEQQMWIRTAQAMEGVLSRVQKNNLIGLNDTILAAGGAVHDPATIMVGIGRKLLESTPIKTGLAVGIDRLGKAISSLPELGIGKVSKSAVLNLINKLTNQ